MIVRGETAADYAPIADLHARAFGNRAAEALIVALHRQRADFDPALSLVAERDGLIVGHALFSPRTITLLGQPLRAVNLAPIAVEPRAQSSGVGGRLIDEGHAIASDRGYALSFLLGHPSFYPRFGYRTFAYGSAALTLPVTGGSAVALEGRPPTSADAAALQSLHASSEAGVDFAIFPDQPLLAWISPDPQIIATVFEAGGEVVGYVRVHQSSPAAPRAFLARDTATARSMINQLGGAVGVEMTLPLHPSSPLAAGLGQAAVRPWEAAMACSLVANPFDEYYDQVQRGERPAGRIVWPVEFDLA